MLPAPLPDLDGLDPETLKALLIAKHNESIEQHKQLRSNSQEIEHLKLVIEKYRRMIFGRKSEKLTRELEQLELRLEEKLAQLTAAIGTRVAMKTVADDLSWQMLGQRARTCFLISSINGANSSLAVPTPELLRRSSETQNPSEEMD